VNDEHEAMNWPTALLLGVAVVAGFLAASLALLKVMF
jgi:hypothetical protein